MEVPLIYLGHGVELADHSNFWPNFITRNKVRKLFHSTTSLV